MQTYFNNKYLQKGTLVLTWSRQSRPGCRLWWVQVLWRRLLPLVCSSPTRWPTGTNSPETICPRIFVSSYEYRCSGVGFCHSPVCFNMKTYESQHLKTILPHICFSRWGKRRKNIPQNGYWLQRRNVRGRVGWGTSELVPSKGLRAWFSYNPHSTE